MLGGVAPAGSSARIATRCSRKSGLPSAAARISKRRRRAPCRPARPRRSWAESVSDSGRSRSVAPRPNAVAHAGRRSSRSSRARQTTRPAPTSRSSPGTGSGRAAAARPTGCRRTRPRAARGRASDSSSRRTAHCTSWADAVELRPADRARHHRGREHVLLVAGHEPLERRDAAEVVHDLLERPVGDALAVGQAAARRRRARRPSTSATNCLTSRDLPMPAGPSTVVTTHRSRG